MLIHSFKNGDQLELRDSSLIASFSGPRKVLSSAPHNGGMRNNLEYVFNHCGERSENSMLGNTYSEHIELLAARIGLNPEYSCGISTGAYAENNSICSEGFMNTEVTAVVTAGIDQNGGRVGDCANWHEAESGYIHIPGTVNIMLFCNNNLSDGAMARALITCTEAKTAAISELAAPSCYSSGLATGSGTDGIIVISDMRSKVILTDAGLHFKLGELIGKAVKKAVKEALYRETGMSPSRQFDFFRRLARFGLTEDHLLSSAVCYYPNTDNETIRSKFKQLLSEKDVILLAIMYAHIIDQYSYELIGKSDAIKSADRVLKSFLGFSETVPELHAEKASGCTESQLIKALEYALITKVMLS